MYLFAKIRTTKKRVEENASVSFFHDHARIALEHLSDHLLFASRGLSSSVVTLEWI